MRIKLSPAQAISLVQENAEIKNGSHLFSIHDGMDHVPVMFVDGQLMVNGEFPLSDIEDGEDVYLFVNSLKSDAENIYSLKFFGKRYSDLTDHQSEQLNTWCKSVYGDGIRSEFVNGVLSVVGFSDKDPSVVPIEDIQVLSVLDGYYRGYDLLKAAQINGDYVVAVGKKNGEVSILHNRLSEFPSMTNKAKNSIEREMNNLQVKFEILKEIDMQLEKTAEVDKSLDM